MALAVHSAASRMVAASNYPAVSLSVVEHRLAAMLPPEDRLPPDKRVHAALVLLAARAVQLPSPQAVELAAIVELAQLGEHAQAWRQLTRLRAPSYEVVATARLFADVACPQGLLGFAAAAPAALAGHPTATAALQRFGDHLGAALNNEDTHQARAHVEAACRHLEASELRSTAQLRCFARSILTWSLVMRKLRGTGA